MSRKIVIVGGGIAGLTAAYTLLKSTRARPKTRDSQKPKRAFEVTVLEADDAPGGQARAFAVQPKAPVRDETGRPTAGALQIPGEAPFVVEHGSHVFFQYYDTILRIVDELRADPALAADMPGLHPVPGWTLAGPRGDTATLKQAPILPEPCSALPSMLAIPWLPLADRIRGAIGALRVLGHTYDELGELDQMTSRELALASGYSARAADAWNSASLGLTNLFVEEQSGAVFWAKHKVLLDYPDGLRYRLPTGDLGKLVAEPLRKKIEALGGKVTLGATVKRIARPEGAPRTTVVYEGPRGPSTVKADHVILAVAPRFAKDLVPWVSAPWKELQPVTPVITVVARLSGWLDGSIEAREIGLDRAHWTFSVLTDLSRLCAWHERPGRTVLRLEIGHADLLPGGPGTPDEVLIGMIEADLARLFPEVAEQKIVVEAYAVHRETERLYTRWVKGAWSKKPAERDVGQGVYLAGDWTTKGTIGMEAAANSGIEAANHVLACAGLPPVPFRDVPL